MNPGERKLNLEAPSSLPVNLSHSSIELYLRCPEKWRRIILEHEHEPASGGLVLGRAVHAAEAQSYSNKVETGEAHKLEQVLDDFSTSLDLEFEEDEVELDEDETPGLLKDRGARLLGDYHSKIVPLVKPQAVEQRFEIRLHPDYSWKITGSIDIVAELDDGFQKLPVAPHDIKTVGKSKGQGGVDSSVQATLYTLAQMKPGEEQKDFHIHELRELKNGPVSTVLTTNRTKETQLLYLERIAMIAREIDWRIQTGNWQGATPGSWWCTNRWCGFFQSCPLATR